MLVASSTSRQDNRRRLGIELRRAAVPRRLMIDRSEPIIEWDSWYAYWKPCREFFEANRRLVHRVNQLKKTWLALLRSSASERRRRDYCWRYFCLLHNALRLAREEPRRASPLDALHRIVAFEAFTIEVGGLAGIAGGLMGNRHPVSLLGRLPADAPLPTPRHVPLVLTPGQASPFYCYRQLHLTSDPEVSLFVLPATELKQRTSSFVPIDRLARILRHQGDPRWNPRARLLTQRVLRPLLHAGRCTRHLPAREGRLTVLDLGAGTGLLTASAWRELRRSVAPKHLPSAALHFVDSAGPCCGRSFGLSRMPNTIRHVEWTKAEYRKLLDDDEWLRSNGPFDWTFMCRPLGNESNVFIEDTREVASENFTETHGEDPCVCLAASRQPEGLQCLRVRTVCESIRGGTFMPQYSLCDYFAAMRAVMAGSLDAAEPGARYLPVRRFNPAALTTLAGRSILAQLMKVTSAIVIEDVDLQAEQLVAHREQFGLEGTGAVQFVRDGFSTQARHFVITRPAIADRLRGTRLW